eukprot:CAMPEP_0194501390 /NCGR_PEP_ID=MMETSP0253-20130528/22648_1 /TAXON_ID=2966 /ORGANISM="Noctiluca scintillans" /LENGTH=303 /DNA_ID=CAMNT_0039343357 /DNA_START=72 /DNA_END=983 /DNA_ORIENTATION=+
MRFVTFLSLFVGAVGIRLKRSTENLGTNVSLLPRSSALFRHAWAELTQSTQDTTDLPMNEDIKLILGVLTIREQLAYQQAVTDTWFNQPGVCLAEEGPKVGCNVYVCFVLGQGVVPEGMDNSTFTTKQYVELEDEENNNSGKSFAWFHFASRRYPWASHVGKLDMDSFPDIRKMVLSLEGHMTDSCARHFVGYAQDFPLCQGDDCPKREDCIGVRELPNEKNCQFLVLGEGYILSRDFAAELSSTDGYWHTNRIGEEDVLTSRAVAHFVQENRACVKWWDSESILHFRYWGHDPDNGPNRGHG